MNGSMRAMVQLRRAKTRGARCAEGNHAQCSSRIQPEDGICLQSCPCVCHYSEGTVPPPSRAT